MAKYGSLSATPGYIESIASTKRKTKEDIRLDSLIPSDILDNAGGIKNLLQEYYKFNNMEEFIYQETEIFSDIILSDKAVFRISDPENSNDHFFNDPTGENSSAVITIDSDTTFVVPLSAVNINISNGNDLPGSLAKSTAKLGKTLTISGLSVYNAKKIKLTTNVSYWVGPGPSYVLNSIEEALNIDENTTDYLELMQKEIAAAIPRDLQVDKRSLYKSIVDFYKVRGSTDSIEIFFRLLFNESVEIEEPWNSTLIPSSGNWVEGKSTTSTVAGAVSNSTAVTLSVVNTDIRLGSIVSGTGITASTTATAASGVSNSTSVTMSAANSLIQIGSVVSGTGITEDKPTVTAVSGTTLTLSAAQTFASGTVLTITHGLPTVSGITGLALTLSNLQTIANNTVLTITQKGSYSDRKGQLSSTIKVQDSKFYQKFSYLIRTGKNVSDWKNSFAKLVHPAGFKFFGEILLLTQLTRAVLGDTDKVSKRVAGTGPTQANATLSDFSNDGFGLNNTQFAYKEIYGRTNRVTLSSMPTLQPGAIGIEDLPLLVQAFVAMFSPNIEARINRSATTTVTISSGAVSTILPVDRGYGYPLHPAAVPVVTISGDGTGATATCTLDELGQVDIITVTAGGSGYTTASASVAANADAGKINEIVLSNLADKRYRTAPTIIISAPTSTDTEGVLLASNVTATAVCVLDAEGEITSVTISNVGSGYVVDPTLKIGSAASGEIRARDIKPILILLLNHLDDVSRSITGNNHFNNKRDYDSITKFRDETPIEHYSSNVIQNGLGTSINRYSSLSNIEQT